MAVWSKRITTTFSSFWLAFGILQILIGYVVWHADVWIDWIIYIHCVICLAAYFVVVSLILLSTLRRTKKNLDFIIILGAQIRGDRVTDALKRRLDKGLAYLQDHTKTVCIVSGGKGRGEDISEASAMFQYLRACGIEEERVVLEDQSKTTYENLLYSAECVADLKKYKIGIVSNNFHIYRAIRIAKKLGYRKVYPLVASCQPIFFLNYMTREFFAILVMVYKSLKERKQ